MSPNVLWKNDGDFTENDDQVNFNGDKMAQRNTFFFMNYITPKYHNKRLWYIACSILVSVLLITIVAVVSRRNTSPAFDTSPLNKLYLIINNKKIMRYDLETDRLTSQFEIPRNSELLSYEISESIDRYWIENLTDVHRIVAQKNDEQKVLLQDKRFKPNALALDQESGNLYATDHNAGLLIAINVHSGHFLILLADMIRPRDIVLDPNEGLLFVLQHLHSIVRAKMDGSSPREIVSKTGITALSIDSSKKRLYWVNDFLSIESSDYDGKNRQSIFTTSTTKIVILTIAEKNLFWVESKQHDNINTVYSCKIVDDDHCEDGAIRKFDIVGNATSIRSYISANRTLPHPCQSNNSGCEHLCLLSGRNKRRCACRMGWQLNAVNRTCEEVRDFVLYPYDGVVRSCTLDGKRELFWPTPYLVDKLTVKTEIDFDYDLKNDYFYFTDDHNIHRMQLKSYTGQEVILSVDSSDMIIDDIAYDWFTGNMYYGQRHVNSTVDHSLMVFNTRMGQSYRLNLRFFDPNQMNVHSYALALDPLVGLVFVAVTTDNIHNTPIHVMNMHGKGTNEFPFQSGTGLQDHRFFTVDYTGKRLYTIHEVEPLDIMYRLYFIGFYDEKHVKNLNFVRARTIAVHQQWLYLSNYSSVWRFDKETGRDGISIAPRIADPAKKIVGVRIISEEIQLNTSGNTCAKNNGGCEQFCFALYTAKCDCKDGQKVDEDGRCHDVSN